MITLKDFMETAGYRISDGDNYGWGCYGPDAYSLSAWNGDFNGWSMSTVFDTKTQQVYEVDVCDYKNQRAYRMIHPDYKSDYNLESMEKEIPAQNAWDDVDFVDLDSDEDFLEKARAIVAGEDYDTRVVIPLDMPDDVVFQLMKMAHEQDITFNQLLENILTEEIERMAQQYPELQEKTAKMKRSKTPKES